MRQPDIAIPRPMAMAHLLAAFAEHGELTGDEVGALLAAAKQRSYLDRYVAFGLAEGCLEAVPGSEAAWSVTLLGLELAQSASDPAELARQLLWCQPGYRHRCELSLARTLLALYKRHPVRPERVEAALCGDLASFAPAFNAIMDRLSAERVQPVAAVTWPEVEGTLNNWEQQLAAREAVPRREWDRALLGHGAVADDDRFNLLRDVWPALGSLPVLLHSRALASEHAACCLVGCLALAAARSSEEGCWWGVDGSRFRALLPAAAGQVDAELSGLRQRLFSLGLYLHEAAGCLALARSLIWGVSEPDWVEAIGADDALRRMPQLLNPPWPQTAVRIHVTVAEPLHHSFVVALRHRLLRHETHPAVIVSLPSGLTMSRYEAGENLRLPSELLQPGAFYPRTTCYGAVPIGGSGHLETRALPRAELWQMLYAHQPFVHLAMQLGLLLREKQDWTALRRGASGCSVVCKGQLSGDFLEVARAALERWGFRPGRIVVTSKGLFDWLEEIGVFCDPSGASFALSDECYHWFMESEGMRNYHADQAYRDWLIGFLEKVHE